MLDAYVLKDKKGKHPSAILNKFLKYCAEWIGPYGVTSAFSKRFRFRLFTRGRENSVSKKFHSGERFREVFIDRFHRIRVEGSRIRKEKVTFSNENGFVWTRP